MRKAAGREEAIMRGKKKKMSQAMAFIVLSAPPFAIFVFAGHSVAAQLAAIPLYIASSRRIKANP